MSYLFHVFRNIYWSQHIYWSWRVNWPWRDCHDITTHDEMWLDRDTSVAPPLLIITSRLLLLPLWSLHHVCCSSPCDNYITSVAPPLLIIIAPYLLIITGHVCSTWRVCWTWHASDHDVSTEHDVSSCYDGSLARLFTYHDVSAHHDGSLAPLFTYHDVSIIYHCHAVYRLILLTWSLTMTCLLIVNWSLILMCLLIVTCLLWVNMCGITVRTQRIRPAFVSSD